MKANLMLLGFTIPTSSGRLLPTIDSQPAIQTFNFGWSLARAIKSGVGNVFLASSVPIQNYPQGKKVFFKSGRFSEAGIDGLLLGFINILLLKHVTRLLSCLIQLPIEIRRRRINWIVLHGVHTPFLIFGLLSRLAGIRLLVTLTDPPGVILPMDGILSRILKRCDRALIGWLLKKADGYICLSPEMTKSFRLSKPSVHFPGILNSNFQRRVAETQCHPRDQPGIRTIVYAGGLSSAYGVDKLIDAIISIASPKVRLTLYGRGDQEGRIIDLAMSDDRFCYGGYVGEDELVPALLAADVLINPRPADKDFSILSFPSKLIEYLATGRPILSTKIISIPKRLIPHFNFIQDSSPIAIQTAIIDLLENIEEAEDRARESKKIVSEEYSEEAVGKKILSLMNVIKNTHY